MNHQQTELVIFDFDGVIVDSEIVFNEILAEEISHLGWKLSTEHCFKLFAGMSAHCVDRLIEEKLDCPLPVHFRTLLNQRIDDAFRFRLKRIPFIEELLESAPNKCIASSGDMQRITLALEVTGLATHFKRSEIFNSQMVKHGKPEPDLFLLAADKMGVPSDRCLVIEDSIYGVQAAHSANMRVIGFIGGTHAHEKEYQEKIKQMNPLFITNDMRSIIKYIKTGIA